MSIELLVGVFLGGATMYIYNEVRNAFNEPSTDQKRLSDCTLEAIKLNADRDLADYSNEELVRAVSAGVQILPRRDDKPGGLHPKVRN
jgi:hypothetical protein